MEFYGLLGEKLSHSLSPKIHKYIYDSINYEGAYKLFPIKREELHKLPEALKLLEIKGINVTIPYKEDIISFLDFISQEAKDIGAINTIKLEDGKLYGYNTDYYGFGLMLEDNNINVKDSEVVILGSGGASKAVLAYVLDKGAKSVKIVSREKKSYNNHLVEGITYEEEEKITGDILINTTPVGMFPNVEDCPLKKDLISNFLSVVDLIYNPLETVLLKNAKALGLKVCGGLEMLINQAIKAEEIWLDINIPKNIYRELYKEISREFK